jgi:branched-chain amino acid aminotransferase
MLDERGFLAETNATHLFMVHDGVVRTPTVAACPEGITRLTVLDILREEKIPHEVRDLSLTELYRADEAFCTGTMGELAGVTKVDGRTIGNGETGPMTARLSALYGRRTAAGGTQVVD